MKRISDIIEEWHDFFFSLDFYYYLEKILKKTYNVFFNLSYLLYTLLIFLYCENNDIEDYREFILPIDNFSILDFY